MPLFRCVIISGDALVDATGWTQKLSTTICCDSRWDTKVADPIMDESLCNYGCRDIW